VACSTNEGPSRIVIVTGVRLYREGLTRMLADSARLEVAATASPSDPLEQTLAQARPDVVLADSDSVMNTNLCAIVSEVVPTARIVAFAVSEENEQEIVGCAQVGVCAFVPKDASVTDLLDVILGSGTEHAGCSPRIVAALIRRVATTTPLRARRGELENLTQREREVLRCVESGCSNKEIAGELGISVITVKNHIHNILAKLSLNRRGEAAALLRSCSMPPERAVASSGSRSF
jgi:DNA-binding NarL/FixJ family response regulator